MRLRIASVTVDCTRPESLARFWTEALGYTQSDDASDDVAIVEDPRDRDVELVFVRVPEPKRVKNRVHLDLGANDMEAEVQRLIGLGAEIEERMERWTVMRDPEGNEFCVLQVPADDPIDSWRSPS